SGGQFRPEWVVSLRRIGVVTFIRISTQAARFDIFEFTREESLFGDGNEALLPQLARAINWFKQKSEIIQAIRNSGDLRKLLTISEWITAQGLRQQLIGQAGEADIWEVMGKQSWIPEIQSLLLKVSQYPELMSKIEESLIYYEVHVTEARKDDEYKAVAYRIRLLIAYFKSDEAQLDREPLPARSAPVYHRDLTDADYKEFYRGLIRIKTQPESAYEIFNRLFIRHPQYPSLAVNRFLAATTLASVTNGSKQYAEALEEWRVAARKIEATVLESLEPEISILLLEVYLKLNYQAEMETHFHELDLPYQMLPDILNAWIESLIQSGRRAEAYHWLEIAKDYHQYGDYGDIQFIRDLEDKIKGTENIDELIIHYRRIFDSAPEKLIRILPERLNGKTEIGEFITQEFVYAGDKMLEKIKAIDVIRDENKYNDLMEALLESRILGYGWSIGGQKRGAFSGANGPQPGERDLPVITADGKLIVTGEALIYRATNNVVPHLSKVFNYYHQREIMLLIMYDTGEKGNDFLANWKSYQEDVLPQCNYPAGHEPSGKFQDVSGAYKVQNSAIKVGKTQLNSGGVIYHLFININYYLTASTPAAPTIILPTRT
ncbi:hypothetical protein ACCC92_10845, partial [Mucilaginibacter sp. Mucisp84]|uniref:hypothetical protein n=1 Tax=Mucilaginibacter sp. Mucisp84 TaxID=3243058 RepID=UPI0039A45107